MSRAVRLIAWGALLGYVAAVPAAAEPPSSGKNRVDPNEVVCETQREIGSRLAKKRICMTRAQWAERRQLDRDVVHRSQTQICVENPATHRC